MVELEVAVEQQLVAFEPVDSVDFAEIEFVQPEDFAESFVPIVAVVRVCVPVKKN